MENRVINFNTNIDEVDFDTLNEWASKYANTEYKKDQLKKEKSRIAINSIEILGNHICYMLNYKKKLVGFRCRSWLNTNGTKVKWALWYEMRIDQELPYYITISLGEKYKYIKVGFDVLKNKINPDKYFEVYNRYMKKESFKNENYEFELANKNGTKVGSLDNKESAIKKIDGNEIKYVRIFSPIKVDICNANRDKIIDGIDQEVKSFIPYYEKLVKEYNEH